MASKVFFPFAAAGGAVELGCRSEAGSGEPAGVLLPQLKLLFPLAN